MAEIHTYFNELSESYAKKNKIDLATAKKAVSKLIRNKEDNYNSLFFRKDLSGPRYGNKLESLRDSFKYRHNRVLELELEKFKDSLRAVKIISSLKYLSATYAVTKREANFLGFLLNTSKDVFNNLKIGKDTYVNILSRNSRRGKFVYTDSYRIIGRIPPKFLSKRKELVFTDIHGVQTAISKYTDNEGFAECLYINNKNVNIFHGYIHIPSSTHGKSIDEIKNLLQKREDLKNASKVKREFTKQIKISSSDILVTRKDSLNAGNCSAGTDNFISRYLENKESVKLIKLYELAKNKDLDSEIKSRLKNVISLKEKEIDNTLNNLDNLVKI
jgi:hypothetical protein